MAITCTLGNQQLEFLYAAVYKNMASTPEGTPFDVRTLMSRLFDKIKEKQGEGAAVEYMQAVPYLAGILSFRLGDMEISPETNLRELARSLMNPETGYAETLKLVSGGLTPQQLGIIAEAEEDASEDEEAAPIQPRPEFKDTDDYKADSAFSSTFEEFLTVDPNKKPESFVEEIDLNKSYIYKTLNNIKKSTIGTTTNFDADTVFQGKTLKLKTILLSKMAAADRTDYSNNFVLRANSIKSPDPNVKKPDQLVALAITDEKGKYIYFDNNGNITAKENGGRIVYQMMRDVRKDGNRYRVTDVYGRNDQLQSPAQIASSMMSYMGYKDKAAFEEGEGTSLADYIKEIDEQQQEDFKALHELRDSVVDGKSSLLRLTSVSTGLLLKKSDKEGKVTLTNLSDMYPETNNAIFGTMTVLENPAKGFEAGATVINIEGTDYKIDRSDITNELATKIAKALTSKLSDEDKFKYYSQFFVDKGFFGTKRHYVAYKRGQFLFTYDTYTQQEMSKDKAKSASNKRSFINLSSPTAEQDIYDILMSGKSSASGTMYPAKIRYSNTAIDQGNYLDFVDGKLEEADYIDFLKTLPAQIFMNGNKEIPLYNSYMRFSVPTKTQQSIEKAIETVTKTNEPSGVRSTKDSLADAIKNSANKSMVTSTMGNSSYGTTPDGKPYANFKIKNPLKETQAVKIYLEQKTPTAEFPFPKHSQKILLEVGNISKDGVVIGDVVQAFDYTDGKKGMFLGQAAETDYSTGEAERVYTAEPGDIAEEVVTVKPTIEEQILKVIDNPIVSQPSDNSGISNLFDLNRSKSLPKGVTRSQIDDAKTWWGKSPLNKYIELSHLANIVNSEAYAKFIVDGNTLANGGKLAKIELYKSGSFADVYHEAWHGFSQLFLTRDQKIELYKELYEKGISKSTSFRTMEEMLAEDFRTYALNQKAKKGSPKRNSIFRKIWNFIKSLFGVPGIQNMSPDSVEQSALVAELFDKLYMASENPSLLNNYTPLVDNVMFDELNRGIENAVSPKEDSLNKQDATLVTESIDSALSEIIDDVNGDTANKNGKSGTVRIFATDKNKEIAYDLVRQKFQQKLAKLQDEITYKPEVSFNEFTNLNDLEKNAAAIIRDKNGEHKYIFLKSQVDDYNNLDLDTKSGTRQKGELYKDSIEIISDFYTHKNIKSEIGEPADILVVSDISEAKNQYENYIKGKAKTFTSLEENDAVINTVPKISYEQAQDLDNIRILQTALNNWGDPKKGVVKYHIENSRFDVVRQKFIDVDAELGATGDATQSEQFDKKVGQSSLLEMADQQIVYILKSLFLATKKGTGYITTYNKLGFKELGNFNQSWKNMVRTLSGITDPKQMYTALVEASNTYPEFKQLLNKIPNPSLPNNAYENDIITSMWQTFQKPEATLLQLTGFKQDVNSEYPTGSIVTELTNSAVDVANTIRDFGSRFKSDTRDAYIERIDNQSMLNITALIGNFSDSNGSLDPDKNFKFLNAMGFYLDNLAVIKDELNTISGSKKYGVSYIFNTVKAISYTENSKVISKAAADVIADFKKDPLATLIKGIPPQTVGPPSSFVYTAGSKQKNSVEKIAGLQIKYGVDASNFTALNPERNLVNKHIEHSSASMIINGFNQATKFEDLWKKDELKYMSSFNPEVNPFVEELQVTKSLFDLNKPEKSRRTSRSLEMDLVMGTQVSEFTVKDENGNEITKSIGTNTTSLDGYGKFLQEFHTFFKGGLQEFLRAGSKSTAMGMRINGGIMSEIGDRKDPRYYIDLDKFLPEGNAESFAFDNIILPYISAETERINRFKASSIAKNYTGYNNKYKNGKMAGESYVYFDSILDKDLQDDILEVVNKPGMKLKDYLKNDPKLYDRIKKRIAKYFDDSSEEVYEFLQQTKYIDKSIMDRLNFPGLSTAEKERILSKAYMYNAWIHNFEVSQVIFGDIAQFKHGKEEFHKRTSGAISSGPKIRTDKAFQDFVNDINSKDSGYMWNRNMYAETLGNADYVKFTYNGTINTAIIQDVDRDSLYVPQIEKAIRADYEKRYAGRPNAKEEVDKRVDIEIDKYKNMTEGDGQGYITMDAYRTLKKGMNKWTDEQELLYKKIVNKQELSAEEITTYFPVFKLQNYGNLANTVLPVTAMHKFALMPLIPSVIRGSELETLHHEMLRNNIQYATFASGSKVGGVTATGKADDIFTDDTQTSIKDTLTLTPNTVYVEYLKESASVPDHYKNKVVFATQLRKIILAGLYDKGKIINADNKRAADRYKDAVDNYTNILKLELLDEINFKKVGDTYKGNLESLLKLIQRELRRKDMPEHLVEAIGLNPDGTLKNDLSIHLDSQTIEKTIMSIVEKRFVKQKLKGEALVQVASSMTKGLWSSGFNFKNATTEEIRKYLGSNTLPFYEPGPNGETTAMKVAIALQGDFVNLLNKEYKGEKIGTIQRLNQLIKDDEWLNTGDNRKAVTLSAVRIPVQGLNSMEFSEVYEFLDPAAGGIIIVPSELVAKSGGDYDVDKLTTFFPHIAPDGSFVTSSENTADFIKRIEAEREKEDKSFAGEIKKQKRAAENEIIDSIRGILQLPDNYVNLVRPNDTYILQDISEELENFVSDYDRFKGGDKENKQISSSIVLHPLYNVHKHAVNMEGKDVLGIAANENAIGPVFDSLGAAMPLDYYPTKWSKTLKRDVEIKKGKNKYKMRLFLPHNSMEDGRISLSDVYSKDGLNSIAELYSQAINGTVDVEKNPWIFFIQGNLEVANVLFYLFKAGVPVKDAIYFVSNPLVRDYVQNQKSLNSAFGEFTGLAPESPSFVKYNAAAMTVDKITPELVNNALKNYNGKVLITYQREGDEQSQSKEVATNVLLETLRKNEGLTAKEILTIDKLSGPPKNRNLYSKPLITNAGFYYSSTIHANKPNILSNGVYNTSAMEELIKVAGKETSPLGVSMFLHFLEIEKQLKGISALKRSSKPDTQTFKSPQEILYRDINLDLVAENSKVDPKLLEALQSDSILSSLFDKKIIMSMLDPLFQLRDNKTLNDFILKKIRLDAAIITNNFGKGKDGASRFIDEYKNGLINFIYQNYMSNIIDSNGMITNKPDDYRGHKIVVNDSQDKDVVINKDSEDQITSISINEKLINADYSLGRYLGKNNALDGSYFKRGLKTFKEVDALFADKSSYLKFVLEREYLRDAYKAESDVSGFENFIADRALMKTFNRAVIMKNNEHSYTDKVMGILKNFPSLKSEFPILEQISRVPSVSGDNVLTLNDRRIITGSQAEIYSQNIKQLANPYIKKVDDPITNKAISDVFALFPQMMIYQHGVGKSKYGFNIALPSDKYNTIMKYASKVFSTNYMNEKTFNVIFNRLTAVKTPFKSYMVDAANFNDAANRTFDEETLAFVNSIAPGYVKSATDQDVIIDILESLVNNAEVNNISDEETIELGQKAINFLRTKDITMKIYQKGLPSAIAIALHGYITEQNQNDSNPEENIKPTGVEESDVEKEIAALRAREQEDLRDAIPNIADYPDTYADVQGNMPDDLYAKYKTIYDKYDLLITSVSSQPTVSDGFQGYKGGFENAGKGTDQGDGKDKAMRQIADGFIGEVLDRNKQTSSNFSAKSIYEKDKTNNILDYFDNAPTVVSYRETGVDGNKIVMLARNGELKNKPLSSETKNQIDIAFNNGGEFVVGDMPGVDSQFIDYLQEISAKFTIYHTGSIPRIELDNTGNLTNFTERKDTEEDDSDDLDNNCTNPFLGE